MTLYAVEKGSPQNETIVLLHGNGVAGWMWDNITPQLEDYHCVQFDLPGHGKSSDIEVDSLAEMADIVAQEIETRFPNKQVYLVGLSLGGMITTLIASRYPHLVKQAVASGVNALPFSRLSQFYFQSITALMSLIMKRDFYIKFNAKLYGITEAEFPEFYETSKRLNMNVFRVVVRDAFKFVVPDNAAHMTTPILYVAGAKENSVILDSLPALAEAMPHSIAAIAPDVEHGWSAENPRLFAEMIRAWFTHSPLPDSLNIVAGKIESPTPVMA